MAEKTIIPGLNKDTTPENYIETHSYTPEYRVTSQTLEELEKFYLTLAENFPEDFDRRFHLKLNNLAYRQLLTEYIISNYEKTLCGLAVKRNQENDILAIAELSHKPHENNIADLSCMTHPEHQKSGYAKELCILLLIDQVSNGNLKTITATSIPGTPGDHLMHSLTRSLEYLGFYCESELQTISERTWTIYLPKY